jgi:hypothetical protein
MNETRVRPPAMVKSIGYVCPRCSTRLLHDYDDLSCYACGYRTPVPSEATIEVEPERKAA